MTKKQYFCIVDTETTIDDNVADFGAVIVDRKGVIHHQCGVMVKDQFDTKELFYDKNAKGLWSLEYAREKRAKYNEMLNAGTRIMATNHAINRWLGLAIGKYDPILTAYNLAFDAGKCHNTGIDLTGFRDRFCLWGAAIGNICKSKAYRQFALENHLFNNVTEKGNMTFSTTAEAVTGFLNGQMTEEPHTSLEDAIGYELPILATIIKKRGWREKIEPYNWRDFQVKDNFMAK